MCLLKVLLLASALAVVAGEGVEAAGSTTDDGSIVITPESNNTAVVSVDIGGAHPWSRPLGVIVTAVLLLIGAAAAPFVVPKLLGAGLRTHIEDEQQQQQGLYGTFSQASLMRTPTIATDSNVHPGDLPPTMEIKWDRSAWGLIHRQLDMPFALAVSAALLSAAVAVLRLPSKWDFIYVRKLANDGSQLFMIAAACFALHRVVELVIQFVENQAWLSRTHMQVLYEQIANQVGTVVKVVGYMVIVVSVLGLTNEETWSQKLFFAFVTAIVIGLVGWVLLELSDTAQALASASIILTMNMFSIGDEIELWHVEHGWMRGRVESINPGRAELIHKGRQMIVPNAHFLKSCVINYTRSHPVIPVTIYVHANSGAEKMRAFAEGARRIASETSLDGTSHSAYYKGNVSASVVPLFLTVTVSTKAHPSEVKARLMMQLLDLAHSVGVQVNA